ncbi:MAG: alpha-glucosidase [Alphaproteobacteria bacterium]|nr:alpha-glucosidase [Alphaproteobacteria bacterium SS10]
MARQWREDWYRRAVVYQIYPRSYADSNGDGIGDLPGIIEKLDYIQSLGVDAIWISPFYKSPMADFGYDVSDYRDVDPIFGTLEDAERLIVETDRRDMAVVMDMVMSHTSDQHAWFIESRADRTNAKADWYVWHDGKPGPDGKPVPPNNWRAVFGGSAWQWDEGRQQFYLHNFLSQQPDLNLHNMEVQDALVAEAKFWLDRGVRGLRLDAINFAMHDQALTDCPLKPGTDGSNYHDLIHLHDKNQPETLDFLRRLRTLADGYRGRFIVGEVYDDNDMAIAKEYCADETLLHTAYNFALFAPNQTAASLRQIFEAYDALPHDSWPSWPLSNHDVSRAVSRFAKEGERYKPNRHRARQLNALLMMLPGTAFMYQGEELGLPDAEIAPDQVVDPAVARGSGVAGRDPCRAPMPWDRDKEMAGFTTASESWLPMPDCYRALGATQQDEPGSKATRDTTLTITRSLIEWRRMNIDLTASPIRFFDGLPEPLLGFARGPERMPVTCLFNLSEDPVTVDVDAPGLALQVVGEGVERLRITAPPYGVLVLTPGRRSFPRWHGRLGEPGNMVPFSQTDDWAITGLG